MMPDVAIFKIRCDSCIVYCLAPNNKSIAHPKNCLFFSEEMHNLWLAFL